MTRKALDRVNLGLGIVRRIGQLTTLVGTVAVIGLVGQSDYETETYQVLHSFEWFTKWMIIWMLVALGGFLLSRGMVMLWRYIRRVNYFYELGKSVYYEEEDE